MEDTVLLEAVLIEDKLAVVVLVGTSLFVELEDSTVEVLLTTLLVAWLGTLELVVAMPSEILLVVESSTLTVDVAAVLLGKSLVVQSSTLMVDVVTVFLGKSLVVEFERLPVDVLRTTLLF